MDADSAIWYLEAALNYALTRADLPVESVLLDSTVMDLQVQNGSVMEQHIWNAYNTLHDALEPLVDDAHHLALINVEGDGTGSPIQLTIYHYLAITGPKRLDTSYGPDDFWMWWNGLNDGAPSEACPCATNPATSGLCADKRIQRRINASVNVPYGYYFTDVTRWTISLSPTDIAEQNYEVFDTDMLNPNDPSTSGDGYRDHYLYTCYKDPITEDWLCASCLDPDAMEWYTQSTWDVMEYIRITHTQRAPEEYLSFKLCKVDGNLCPCDDGGFLHTASFEYGVLRQGNGNISTQ